MFSAVGGRVVSPRGGHRQPSGVAARSQVLLLLFSQVTLCRNVVPFPAQLAHPVGTVAPPGEVVWGPEAAPSATPSLEACLVLYGIVDRLRAPLHPARLTVANPQDGDEKPFAADAARAPPRQEQALALP
ncbi:hypothetical protein CGMCC3_g17888 [Colletotrichum fructicola]|nr:uncharacterized protein CGMCC3_g17888 [Colletotrichum fructicola]KAE9565931.1 hypothetical protein CGMCC3_g17888 [Colletotrichum fructicola]